MNQPIMLLDAPSAAPWIIANRPESGQVVFDSLDEAAGERMAEALRLAGYDADGSFAWMAGAASNPT